MAHEFQFGDFTLDQSSYRLLHGDRLLRLEKRPMDLLILLVERRGELVTRDEIADRLWGKDVFLDVDQSINTAVRKVRRVLRDNPDNPRFVETVVGRGYRFAASVICRNGALNSEAESAAPAVQTAPESVEGPRVESSALTRRSFLIVGTTVIGLIVAGLISWWIRPPADPVVETITQLTNDFTPKQPPLATDGSRIYFNEGATGSWNVAEVSVTGGTTRLIPTRLEDPQILGIASDGSSLLTSSGEGIAAGLRPVWTMRLPNGEPHRLGTMEAQSANIFPDGRVLFAQGRALYVSNQDGSTVRKLLTAPSPIVCQAISPDGSRIVFTTYGETSTYSFANAFFEAASDGSNMHEIQRGTEDAGLGCPAWTPDGNYLVYVTLHPNRFDISVVGAGTRLISDRRHPVELTRGPLSYAGAIPSHDGKHIFAIGTEPRGEIVRYDLKAKQYVPFLGGISAIDPSFSRDGQWVAYTSYSDHTLWRSRADGTDRLQLTYPPMKVSFPIIGLDGKAVAFMTSHGETYVVSMDGGLPRKVAEASSGGCLSPDGNSIVLTLADRLPDKNNIWRLKTLDLRNGAMSDVPESRGKVGVLWVTQDTLVAATEDFTKLLTFSFSRGEWTELVSDMIVNWMHSPDGSYVYYASGGAEPKVMRVRLADHKVEEITSLKGMRRVVDTVDFSTQISVAPDGSPVFTRDLGTQEIYSLTVKWR